MSDAKDAAGAQRPNPRPMGLASAGKIAEIRPQAPRQIAQAEVDRVGEGTPFTSREAVTVRRKAPRTSAPTANLSMRPDVDTFNRFVAFAEARNVSLPKALRELLDRSDELDRHQPRRDR